MTTTKNRNTKSTLAALLLLGIATSVAEIASPAEVACYFSPAGQANLQICQRLDQAKNSIDVAAYYLSEPTLCASLSRAHARGVAIRIIVDPSQEQHDATQVKKLRATGITIETDRHEKLFHNKYAVLDSSITITGSMNWTTNGATKNAENVVIITDNEIAKQFTADFDIHWQHSAGYVQRPTTQPKPNTPPVSPPPVSPPPTKKEAK